jgi:hypothetical protein
LHDCIGMVHSTSVLAVGRRGPPARFDTHGCV